MGYEINCQKEEKRKQSEISVHWKNGTQNTFQSIIFNRRGFTILFII